MILSIAQASTEDAGSIHFFGIWSDVVVGEERPAGLLDCYLLEGDGEIQVAAVWETLEAHDAAVEDEMSHPAFGFFEACGLDPKHAVYRVVGHLH